MKKVFIVGLVALVAGFSMLLYHYFMYVLPFKRAFPPGLALGTIKRSN